jgi:regulator of RNase E activity RraA
VGVVVDGGVRDVAYLRGCNFSVVARYLTPARSIGRWRVTASQVPVEVRGALQDTVTIRPGDIIVSDDDGTVVVPQELLDSVFDRVIEWASSDSGARHDIQNGLPLLAALEKYGHL